MEESLALASPELTLEDFQSLPLAPGVANIEPDGGNVLIRVPTNVYVNADTQNLTTTLLGQPVQVRATPVRYSWDFGDGSDPVVTTDAGEPYPELRVTYAYPERGQHTITLTTYYTGEFSVAGGPWLPVAGEAQVLSESVPVRVLAGSNSLVADALP